MITTTSRRPSARPSANSTRPRMVAVLSHGNVQKHGEPEGERLHGDRAGGEVPEGHRRAQVQVHVAVG